MQNRSEQARQLARRLWKVARATVEGLTRNEAGLRAAALAYQGLFSLFPLLLFLIFIGGQLLAGGDVRGSLDEFLSQAVPTEGALDFIQEIIDQSVRNRGSIGLVGGLGLLWTSSSLLNNLTTSLNAIWGAPRRPVWRRRLVAIAGVLSLGTLFLVAIVFSALPALPFIDRSNPLWGLLDLGMGVVVEVALLWVIYRWLPNVSVRAAPSLIGALLATGLWEVAQSAFRFYVTSALTNFDAVYGTLGSVIGLILWAYFTGFILFLGAELAAALQREFWPGRVAHGAPDRRPTSTQT